MEVIYCTITGLKCGAHIHIYYMYVCMYVHMYIWVCLKLIDNECLTVKICWNNLHIYFGGGGGGVVVSRWYYFAICISSCLIGQQNRNANENVEKIIKINFEVYLLKSNREVLAFASIFICEREWKIWKM